MSDPDRTTDLVCPSCSEWVALELACPDCGHCPECCLCELADFDPDDAEDQDDPFYWNR